MRRESTDRKSRCRNGNEGPDRLSQILGDAREQDRLNLPVAASDRRGRFVRNNQLTDTVTVITVPDMTATVSSAFAAQSAVEDRADERRQAQRELQKMSDAMVEEKGLLNHAQAGLMLDVSTKRVGELVRLGKLTRFDFLGRTYVSMREIWERNRHELRAGKPPRPIGRRIAARLKAAVQTDSLQARLGGYAGPSVKAEYEAAKKNRQQKFSKKWREIRDAKK